MNRPAPKKRIAAGAALAASLVMALAAGFAQAQQGPRYGLAGAVAAPPVPVPMPQPQPQPRILIRSHPIYVGSGWYAPVSVPNSSSRPSGPYLTGPGQWVPTGAQAEAPALQWEPGYTRATAAAASGHWDWKRATLAELVELSRQNKARGPTN